MAAFTKLTLAPAGSTGNNTHTGVSVPMESQLAAAIQFVVEVIGGTPTVTWKAQGSFDGSNWYDILYISDSSDTAATTTRTATTVSTQIEFVSNAPSRSYNQFRVVTSSNTNVTYRAELYVADAPR